MFFQVALSKSLLTQAVRHWNNCTTYAMLFSNQDKWLPQHPRRYSLSASLLFACPYILSIHQYFSAYSMWQPPWKYITFSFLKIGSCKSLSRSETNRIHFAEKYQSKWHLRRSVLYPCTSHNHRNSGGSLALIQLITLLILEKARENTTVFSLSNPTGKTVWS